MGTADGLPHPLISSSVLLLTKGKYIKKTRAQVASRNSAVPSEVYETKWYFLLSENPPFLNGDAVLFKGFQVFQGTFIVMLLAFYLKSLLN